MGQNSSITQKVGQKGGGSGGVKAWTSRAAQRTDAHCQEGALFNLCDGYGEIHISV